MKSHEIETSHGRIAIRESRGNGTPLLMIHGNSSAGAIFAPQLEGEIGRNWRVIAPDLRGMASPATPLIRIAAIPWKAMPTR